MTKVNNTWRNPWVFGAIGLVLTAVSVNALLIWWSMEHGSSFVDQEYKVKSRKSDTETLAYIEAQNALAWQISIKAPKQLVMNQPLPYEISVTDREGKPVDGTMKVRAYRPSDATQDFWTDFNHVSTGNYSGNIKFPLKGYWELRIQVTRGEDVFETQTGKFMIAETL